MTDYRPIKAARDAIASELSRIDLGARADQLTDDELEAVARAAIVAYETEVARLFWQPLPENIKEQADD